MRILIKSRKQIEMLSKHPFNIGTALISITDFNDCAVKLINKPDFLLRVAFDDVDNDVIIDEVGRRATEEEKVLVEQKYHMISNEQACKIAQAYYRHKNEINTLICQCEHGQSRSAAVASAILEYRSKCGIDIFADDRYYPNKVVFRRLLSALRALTSLA